MTDKITDLLGLVKASDSNVLGKPSKDLENNFQKIDEAFTTTMLKVTAGTGGLPAFRIVYITSLGTALSASNANPTHMGRVVGMTVETIAEGEAGLVRRIGRIENESWSLTPGMPYFLGEGGEIINTIPESGFIQYIGVSESQHVLALSLGIPVKRLGG